MAKNPRSTKGVPEPVFQRELFNYLKRKEANPKKNVDASFVYNGIKYTFERGNGPYHSGFQIKKSSDQAAKQSAKYNKDRNIKLSEGEKMFLQTYYDVANERNVAEGRTGDNKLEVDHQISRADGGLHHPYNVGLTERKENIRKGSDSNYGNYKYESLIPTQSGLLKLVNLGDRIAAVADIVNGDDNVFTKATKLSAELIPGPAGLAAQAFNSVNEMVANGNGGDDIFDAIPNGSQEERREKNLPITNGIKVSVGQGGLPSLVTNEITYMADSISNGTLPYNGSKGPSSGQ